MQKYIILCKTNFVKRVKSYIILQFILKFLKIESLLIIYLKFISFSDRKNQRLSFGNHWHFSSIFKFIAYNVSVSVENTAATHPTKNPPNKTNDPHFIALNTFGYYDRC